MNTERTNALQALETLFADRNDVRVYNAAGRRVAVKVTAQRRIVEVVWDVNFRGSSYDVEGVENLYCADLDEVLSFVENKVNDAMNFFCTLPNDRKWNEHASPNEMKAFTASM